MTIVISICGAFFLGMMVASGSLIWFWWHTMQPEVGLHAFLHGIALGHPDLYAMSCQHCRKNEEALGLAPFKPNVTGCPHCQMINR